MRKAIAALLAGLLLCAQTPMLPGFPPGTFQNRAAIDAGGGIVFNIAYGGDPVVDDSSSQTTYTFPSVLFSSADPNRYAVAAICIRSGSTVSTPTVTIGGAATTKVAEGGAGTGAYSGLFQTNAAFPTGTSATVVVSSFGSAAARAGAAGYSVVTSTSTPPSGGATASLSVSGATLTGSVTVPANGRSIVVGCNPFRVSSSVTAPASGITQDFAQVITGTSTWENGAHDTVNRTGATTYTVTYDDVPDAGAVAAWGP